MINKKKVDNVQVALEGLENGMTIMLGGSVSVVSQKTQSLNW
jgi:acyl CoA:acetate/3-ketoacid CoA transferase alpha subunit